MYLIYFESHWGCEYADGVNTAIYNAYRTLNKAIQALKEPSEELYKFLEDNYSFSYEREDPKEFAWPLSIKSFQGDENFGSCELACSEDRSWTFEVLIKKLEIL